MPKVKRRGTTKAPSHWLTADGPRRPPSAPPDFKLNFAAIRKMSNTQSRSTLFSLRISGATALKLISLRAFSSRWLLIKGRAKRLSPVQSSFFVVRNIRNVSNWPLKVFYHLHPRYVIFAFLVRFRSGRNFCPNHGPLDRSPALLKGQYRRKLLGRTKPKRK